MVDFMRGSIHCHRPLKKILSSAVNDETDSNFVLFLDFITLGQLVNEVRHSETLTKIEGMCLPKEIRTTPLGCQMSGIV